MAIKIREMMPVEVLRPIVDEAHKLGLKVTGHLRAMRASDAAEAGIDGLEHASGIVQSTLDPWLRIDLDTLEAIDIYAKYVAERKAYSLISRPRGEALIADLARRDVALIPTMSGWWRMASDRIEQFRHEDAVLADDPALGYVPEQARSIWSTSQLYDIKDSDDLAQLHVGYDIIRHLLRAHAELGGRVLAGSDTYLSVPGLSLQQRAAVPRRHRIHPARSDPHGDARQCRVHRSRRRPRIGRARQARRPGGARRRPDGGDREHRPRGVGVPGR